MRALALVTLVFAAACGGKSFTDDGFDASAGDGSAHGTPDGATDASSDAGHTDAAADSGTSCADLRARVDALRVSAKKCCATCNMIQCDQAAPDMCCPFSYSGANQAAVDEFERALTEYKNQCGPFACPAIPCQVTPSMNCDPSTSLCR
jgi:hypothetical protein